jgi:hypothetical protein
VITAPHTRTCVAPVLANLHPPLSQDGGSTAHVPAGLRMQGDYAAPGGADIDFHSDSAVVACGTIATLYPYTVEANGSEPVVHLSANGKPAIDLKFGPERKTLIGSGTLQVTGRAPTGSDQDGNLAYTQRTASCALGNFTVVTDDTPVDATAAQPAPSSPAAAHPNFATAAKPLGNAVLSIKSGFPSQGSAQNPLASSSFTLMRSPVAAVLAKSGASVPAQTPAEQAVHDACASRKPECEKYLVAISNDAATAAKSDATGGATLPGVAPGTYYLTSMAKIGQLILYWQVKVDLKAGTNSLTLDTRNAEPVK